ncbi:MAG: acetate--CoA ligase, partial [SAR324 cluster bacterium]|nr:acetate--CoA ligase [SAR324 cluster bacterium]
MSELFEIPQNFKGTAWADDEKYQQMYRQSLENPEAFWAEQAERVDWFKKWDKVLDWNYHEANIRWFEGGQLNVSYNCLDRHLEKKGDQIALIWEGDDPEEDRSFTYRELHEQVCRFANVLKQQGIEKGDRVMIYMPMVPELAMACLACARIGAIHSVVFGGFSAEALKSRIQDCRGKMMITADAGLRGKKSVPLKANADAAMEGTSIETCLVLKRTGDPIEMKEGRDVWLLDAMEQASSECPAEALDAEDPLFILYTSGSTGKPKGVLHTSGGYLVYASITHQYVFDYHDGDIYWCTADIGWITGHSYILYGPLSNGATTLMFEGVPNYPDFGRFWDVCDKHKVNIFYTAPTAIRAIAKEGDELVQKRDLSSLKLLGTVGEPINPEAWMWYHRVVGQERCPIVDTWWQTE